MTHAITQFHLQPTHASANGMSHACLYTSSTAYDCPLTRVHFPFHCSRRLS